MSHEPPESLRRRGLECAREALDEDRIVALPAGALTEFFGPDTCAWLAQRKAPPAKQRRYLRRPS